MQQIGVQLYFGPAGRTTEEIHGTAAAQHLHTPVPRLRLAHRFNHNIGAMAAGKLTHSSHGIGYFFGHNHAVGSQPQRFFRLHTPAGHSDDTRAAQFCQTDEHGSDGAHANHRHRIAGPHLGVFHAFHDTGEWFGQGGIAVIQMRGNQKGIELDDATWNANILRIGAVVEEQVFAQIQASAPAIETLQTGR